MKKCCDIVYMGTPDFAVPAFRALHDSRHNIKLVITQPDRPKGRGRKLIPTPVKKVAQDFQYTVLQPETVDSDAFIKTIEEIQPDIIIVVAFGHILKDKLIRIPTYGVINIHPSLLPKYRGPAPIQHSIISGDEVTGVSIMRIDVGMDSGDILLSKAFKIDKNDTSASLHDRLSLKGAELLIETIDTFDTITPVPQDHEKVTYAPLLKKKDGLIDWQKSSSALDCFIRGMTPWPGAFTYQNQKQYKIFKVKPVDTPPNSEPGTVIKGFKDELVVATGNGTVSILEIQGASGKRLQIKDFLRGNTIEPGSVFG